MLDDNTLVFNEATGKHTYHNIRVNPKVAVAVANRDVLDGYRFVGTAAIHESDELYPLKPATAGERIV